MHMTYQDIGLDGYVVKLDTAGLLRRLVHVQQHVDEVPVIVFFPPPVAMTPLAVVRDDPVEQGAHLLRRARRLGFQPHKSVDPRQPRHELPHGHRPKQLLEVGEQVRELLTLAAV